jgi:protein tyrosine/serine phosphatase
MSGREPRPRSGPLDLHQWRLWLSGVFGSRYDGLCHFAVVEAGVLMRCGQPRVRELEQIRVEHGLCTVVCARGGTRHPLRGRWFRKERAYCRQMGIALEHMPFSDAATPPAMVFDRFLEIVAQPERRPVLVHCEQGFHRTGILCAAYRIRMCDWPIERALDELRSFGFDIERPKRRPLLDALLVWARR